MHRTDSRWWVITEPANLYSQEGFKSRDVALTFHIGLAIRVSSLHERKVPVKPDSAYLLPGSLRRWEQAFSAYDSGDEADSETQTNVARNANDPHGWESSQALPSIARASGSCVSVC